jgi:hypothetical protein
MMNAIQIAGSKAISSEWTNGKTEKGFYSGDSRAVAKGLTIPPEKVWVHNQEMSPQGAGSWIVHSVWDFF